MKYLDEYRDAELVHKGLAEIRRTVTRPWRLMEICGGQTHSIVKFGIDSLLPPEITLVHGPGCPVCVTPVEMVNKAIVLSAQPIPAATMHETRTYQHSSGTPRRQRPACVP